MKSKKRFLLKKVRTPEAFCSVDDVFFWSWFLAISGLFIISAISLSSLPFIFFCLSFIPFFVAKIPYWQTTFELVEVKKK